MNWSLIIEQTCLVRVSAEPLHVLVNRVGISVESYAYNHSPGWISSLLAGHNGNGLMRGEDMSLAEEGWMHVIHCGLPGMPYRYIEQDMWRWCQPATFRQALYFIALEREGKINFNGDPKEPRYFNIQGTVVGSRIRKAFPVIDVHPSSDFRTMTLVYAGGGVLSHYERFLAWQPVVA